MKKISRRDFLKASVAGAASAAAVIWLPGCAASRDDSAATPDAGSHSEDPQGNVSPSELNLSTLSQSGFAVEEQTVVIPGLQKAYHFIFINDLHILIPNEEVKADSWDEVMDRYEDGFMDIDGVKAYALWDEIVEVVNALEIDGVILGGDLIDYFSQANFSCFKEGCDRLQAPFLYIRADHDYADGYTENITQEAIKEAEKAIDGNGEILCMDCDEFVIVGINNSTDPISDTGVQELERIWEQGKPVILVIHVPFDSQVEEGLQEASREAWQDRALLWGYEDTLYAQYAMTDSERHLLDMVYAPDTPIAAVFAGHLHFSYDGMLTEILPQHIFDASFRRTVGYITVTGDNL